MNITQYCPTCMDNYISKNPLSPVETSEKYKKAERGSGDWVVLIPDQKSANNLEQIAKFTSQSMAKLTGLPHSVDPYSASRIHLSLSSPLGLLSAAQSKNLLDKVQRIIPQDLNFTSKMEKGLWNKSQDIFKFQFTGLNYQPYVTLTSTQIADQNSTLSKLMNEVNKISEQQGLLSPGSVSNHRRPHFTVGQVTEPSRLKVHNTFYNCMHNKMRWENHDEVVKNNAQNLNSNTVSISFAEVAILRVIREEEKPARYYKVGSVSLANRERTLTIYDTPKSWGTQEMAELATKLERLTIGYSPTPEDALKMVLLFDNVKNGDGLNSPCYMVDDGDEIDTFVIAEHDFNLGDHDYYTGAQLNEKYKEQRGNFDFAKALMRK